MTSINIAFMEILEIPNLDSWSEWSCSLTCGSGDQTRTRNCVRGACTDIDSSSTYQRGRCYPGDCPQCHVSAHCDRRSTDDDAKICHQHICESCENLRSALACQERFRYTPSASNVQHLNSPKKCCTLGTLFHIGDIAQENEIF